MNHRVDPEFEKALHEIRRTGVDGDALRGLQAEPFSDRSGSCGVAPADQQADTRGLCESVADAFAKKAVTADHENGVHVLLLQVSP